jgi:hypothetical protein
MYLGHIRELKIIDESTQPEEVNAAAQRWLNETEAPAMTLMRGIRDAAETYFRAIGRSDIDFSKEPEEFVYSYGPILQNLPYFSKYIGIASTVAEIMISFKPGRKIVWIAYGASMLKILPEKYVNREKVVSDVARHRQAGLHVPAIAADL